MPYINPFLAFADEAQVRQAVALYVSLFPEGRIVKEVLFREGDPAPAGTLCALSFSLGGQALTAIVGGPHFPMGAGVSLYVNCQSQAEIDRIYEGLGAEGGQAFPCGWVTDKFGVTWQIEAAEVEGYMLADDAAAAHRAMSAVWGMAGKIDRAAVVGAWQGA